MNNKKIALVTGASRGIGKDIALKLAKSNIDVIITYRENQDSALSVAKEAELLGTKVSVMKLDI
jgi:NAD(P)-dependent dehydrogenase (short-subunit alcohol dehydrogenase family)